MKGFNDSQFTFVKIRTSIVRKKKKTSAHRKTAPSVLSLPSLTVRRGGTFIESLFCLCQSGSLFISSSLKPGKKKIGGFVAVKNFGVGWIQIDTLDAMVVEQIFQKTISMNEYFSLLSHSSGKTWLPPGSSYTWLDNPLTYSAPRLIYTNTILYLVQLMYVVRST